MFSPLLWVMVAALCAVVAGVGSFGGTSGRLAHAARTAFFISIVAGTVLMSVMLLGVETLEALPGPMACRSAFG